MKSPSRILSLFAACAYSLAAFAQSAPEAAQTPAPPENTQQPAAPPATAPAQAAPAQQPATAPPAAPTGNEAPAAQPGKETPPAGQASPSTAAPAPAGEPPAADHTEPAKTTRRTKVPVELPPPPSAYNGHPKLVIVLVIDQFRADYLERYRADFKGRGFKLFLEKGAYFPDCYYDYANTKTAPGHATIGTGSYTDGHGISSNEW